MKHLSIILLLFIFTSCDTYSEEEKKNFDKEIKAHLKENNKECE